MKRVSSFIAIISLAFLSASCGGFGLGQTTAGGVLKTANGGVDWQFSNKVKNNTKASMSGVSVSKLAFDPTATDKLYLGSYNSGLYKSEDGGESWESILSRIQVYDFVLHPNDPQTIYAAGMFDNRGRVLVTRDAGKSWNEVYSDAGTNTPIRAIALNPSNPQEVIIGSARGTIIKSSDAGSTWKLVQNYNDRVNRIYWESNAVYVVVRTTGVFRSFDGGNSFQNITSSIQTTGNTIGIFISSNPVGVYNQLAFSRSNTDVIYMTTDQGVYRTLDGGNSWGQASLPARKQDAQPQAIGVAPTSDNVVYVGTVSNVYKTSDGGQTWLTQDTKTNTVINALLVNPDIPQVAYAGVFLP